MLAIVEPLPGFSAPIAVGLFWLAVLAVSGMGALVALVAATKRPRRQRATVTSLQRRLPKAA